MMADKTGAPRLHSFRLDQAGRKAPSLCSCPDGRLAVLYWNFNGTEPFNDDFIELVVSNDGGVTFGSPKFVTTWRSSTTLDS